jgi:hypothetical protein
MPAACRCAAIGIAVALDGLGQEIEEGGGFVVGFRSRCMAMPVNRVFTNNALLVVVCQPEASDMNDLDLRVTPRSILTR